MLGLLVNVLKVIAKTDKELTQMQMEANVPWLFPSPTRIDKQRLNNQESAYIKSTLTRLKSTKGFWDRPNQAKLRNG
jgi:hypothetical protein